MKLSDKFGVTRVSGDTVFIECFTDGSCVTVKQGDSNYDDAVKLWTDIKAMGQLGRDSYGDSIARGENFFPMWVATLNDSFKGYCSATGATKPIEPSADEKALRGITNLMNFFSEFGFEPNFRFINTLAMTDSKEEAKNYVTNYFELTDSGYLNEIKEKLRSLEFGNIVSDIMAKKPTKRVNNRFKIYYGSQGTGKTTKAMVETSNRCIVCNNSMLPADLMEDFAFDEGKASFHRTALREAMESGKPIVLDEINLLPFESLRFLQGILDNKTEFLYKNETVSIKNGFEIIGTMNLSVNGMTYGLPEPLVDRCKEIKKYKLTSKDLITALA